MLTILFELGHLSFAKITLVDFLQERMLLAECIYIPFGGIATVTNTSLYEFSMKFVTFMLRRIETF